MRSSSELDTLSIIQFATFSGETIEMYAFIVLASLALGVFLIVNSLMNASKKTVEPDDAVQINQQSFLPIHHTIIDRLSSDSISPSLVKT